MGVSVPNTLSNYFSTTVTVGEGVEVSGVAAGSTYVSADFSSDSLFIDFNTSTTWTTVNFNGFRFMDLNDTFDDISGFSLSTNMVGLNAGDISFTENSMSVNWNGLFFNSSTYVEVALIFA